jgi:hypothetical protein
MRRGRNFDQGRKARNPEPHPIWRGLGCVFMVIIPLLSMGLADLLIDANFANGWIRIPRNLLNTFTVPGVMTITSFYAKAAFTVVIAVILFGLYTVFYASLYSMFGPPKLGPQDVPPVRPRRKVRRSR